jgi:hypothetical protein
LLSIEERAARLEKLIHPISPSLYRSHPFCPFIPTVPSIHHTLLFSPTFFYSRLTSRPKNFAFVQSSTTNIRFRVLKHMLRYALFQKRYVIVPPEARLLPFHHEKVTSATAFSAPMYASEPWCE